MYTWDQPSSNQYNASIAASFADHIELLTGRAEHNLLHPRNCWYGRVQICPLRSFRNDEQTAKIALAFVGLT